MYATDAISIVTRVTIANTTHGMSLRPHSHIRDQSRLDHVLTVSLSALVLNRHTSSIEMYPNLRSTKSKNGKRKVGSDEDFEIDYSAGLVKALLENYKSVKHSAKPADSDSDEESDDDLDEADKNDSVIVEAQYKLQVSRTVMAESVKKYREAAKMNKEAAFNDMVAELANFTALENELQLIKDVKNLVSDAYKTTFVNPDDTNRTLRVQTKGYEDMNFVTPLDQNVRSYQFKVYRDGSDAKNIIIEFFAEPKGKPAVRQLWTVTDTIYSQEELREVIMNFVKNSGAVQSIKAMKEKSVSDQLKKDIEDVHAFANPPTN